MITARVLMFAALAMICGVAPAGATPTSSAEAAPSAATVAADIREAAARFAQGRTTQALELLDGLATRLGDAGRRRHPIIEVMRGRCLAALDRPEHALAAYDRAIAWSDRDVESAQLARRRAEGYRAELLESALGGLMVQCGPVVRRVRLPARGEVRDCPARWPMLPLGPLRVEAVEEDGATGGVLTVDVVAGRETQVEITADADARWRFGARLGAGVASIIGETVYVDDVGPGSALRVVGTVETPRAGGWLSGSAEVGASRSVMSYTDTGAVDPGGEPRAAPRSIDLVWWQLEGALLGRLCAGFDRWSGCAVAGAGLGALISAEADDAGRVSPSDSGRDQAHVFGRVGLEVQVPWSGWMSVLGLHGSYSPWPGALQFANGRMSHGRVWLDVGFNFCGLEPACRPSPDDG